MFGTGAEALPAPRPAPDRPPPGDRDAWETGAARVSRVASGTAPRPPPRPIMRILFRHLARPATAARQGRAAPPPHTFSATHLPVRSTAPLAGCPAPAAAANPELRSTVHTSATPHTPDAALLLDSARDLYDRSMAEWGPRRATVVVGRHPLLAEALSKTARFAAASSPVLITGETGTGKELFARALFLHARRHRRTMLSVNCAQYVGTELVASELFGHRKGSFTGAANDHRGIFEEADGGFVFLDEIGDLPLQAQAMLLRTLSEGEVVPVGSNQVKRVDVRVVAATSRDLAPMIAAGRFRADLYYRLRPLHVQVPSLASRGDDWELIARHFLDVLEGQERSRKELSPAAVAALRRHRWPGNVREVKSVVETGFHVAEGRHIMPDDIQGALEVAVRGLQQSANEHGIREICARLSTREACFWEEVHRPFLERDLNREEVRGIINMGLEASRGSYKRLVDGFGMNPDDYLKFMDFLRHHRLKPELQ